MDVENAAITLEVLVSILGSTFSRLIKLSTEKSAFIETV